MVPPGRFSVGFVITQTREQSEVAVSVSSVLRSLGWILGVLLGLSLALLGMFGRRVVGEDMAHSLSPGDWVWVVPDRVRRADVVALTDPLDPSKTVLRRVVAGPGQLVSFDEGGLRVDHKRLRQEEMGDLAGYKVRKETIWSRPPARANEYLLRVDPEGASFRATGEVKVPEGHWFVLADDRDRAVDSRWWGPVPEGAIKGVIRARLGVTDVWRSPASLWIPEE
jgi:signal peptidase I